MRGTQEAEAVALEAAVISRLPPRLKGSTLFAMGEGGGPQPGTLAVLKSSAGPVSE